MSVIGYQGYLKDHDIAARCDDAKEKGYKYLLHMEWWSTRDLYSTSDESTLAFYTREELFGGLLYEEVGGLRDHMGFGFKDFFALDGWTGTGRGPLSDDDYKLQEEIKSYLQVREHHLRAVGAYTHQSGLERTLRRWFLSSADPLADIRERNGILYCPNSGAPMWTQDKIAARCIADGLILS